MIDLSASEHAVHGVVNDANQTIIKGRRHLAVAPLNRQDQRFVIESLGDGLDATSRRDEAKRGFGGGGGPRQWDS